MQKSTSKQSTVKNRRKFISPIFHEQSEDDDSKYLSKQVIKSVRKTGVLTLSGKHLASVPAKIFTMYDLTDENAVNVDFNRTSTDEELWWNLKPLTNLDLSSNVLTEIPGQIGIFQDLTVINVQDNQLTSLPKEITSLIKLTKLILNRNKINQLPSDIEKLKELRVLNVSHNCIQQLPDSLVDLVMLEKLDLSNNVIDKLPFGIGFLVRLNDLNLSHNKLVELPPDIVNLRSLLRLELSHNSIKNLPEFMGELRKLQILWAQHNDIENIPDFTGCENLQEIYLGNNFIKEISADLCENLLQLKILDLRDNQIKILPKQISLMVHLTKLDISNNEISDIPPSIGLLPHLHSLKIEGNKLKQIRADIVHTGTQRILQFLREKLSEDDLQNLGGNVATASVEACVFPDRYKMRNGNILNLTLKNLTTVPDEVFSEALEARVSVVELCKNKLTEVPSGLKLISDHVTELNLAANQLKQIPNFLGNFVKLKFLDLSNNFLSDLPDDLSSLTNLRELVLFNNRFKKVPNCVYSMLGLEILMLNDNNLGEIDIDELKKLNRLATLNLSNNNINLVPAELGNMTHLRSLELKGNPFRQPRYAILEQGTESTLAYLRDKIPV